MSLSLPNRLIRHVNLLATAITPSYLRPFSRCLVSVLSSYWRHRHLILQMARRDVIGRYRGSVLGLAWSFLTPLLMLSVYTFLFGVVFKSRWGASAGRGRRRVCADPVCRADRARPVRRVREPRARADASARQLRQASGVPAGDPAVDGARERLVPRLGEPVHLAACRRRHRLPALACGIAPSRWCSCRWSC